MNIVNGIRMNTGMTYLGEHLIDQPFYYNAYAVDPDTIDK